MSDLPTLPIILKPNRTKHLLLLLVCFIFVAIGVWMIHDGESMGYLCALFFGLGIPVFLVNMHPRASYLTLDKIGFTFCSLFRAHSVRWADIAEFGVISLKMNGVVRVNRMVAWNFLPGRASGGMRAMSQALSGYDAALPDTYSMKAPDLAELMSVVHAWHGGPASAPGSLNLQFDRAE